MHTNLPSINTLNNLIDPAQAARLRPYDDGRIWILVLDSALSLGEVALASMKEDSEVQFTQWYNERKIAFHQSLPQITEDDSAWFDCLYFENAYFIRHRNA